MTRKPKKPAPRRDAALEKLREALAELAKRPCKRRPMCSASSPRQWCWPCYCRFALAWRSFK